MEAPLKDLEMVAEDQLRKAVDRAPHHEETPETQMWRKRLEAIALVQRINEEISEWVACLRCGLAFPNSEEHGQHYTSAHRSRF